MLRSGAGLAIAPGIATLINSCNQFDIGVFQQTESSLSKPGRGAEESIPLFAGKPMKVQYLEIVTPAVEAICVQYSALHGIQFGEPDANLGGARTAKLSGGGLIGIRGPMHDAESPVVRPYVLVDDIHASVKSAVDAGAEIALPPMEIPEHGTCAIVIHGGIDCGLWQI